MVKSSGYLKLTGGFYGKNQPSLLHQERDIQPIMTKDSDSDNNIQESNQETSEATSEQYLSPNEDNFIVSKRPEKVLDKLPLRRNPENVVNVSNVDHGVTFSKLPEKPIIDGFNWRKYGQKLVRGNSFARSYYKCTYANCPARKQVERSHDGNITEINYLLKHQHPKPLSNQPKGSETLSENFVGVEVLQIVSEGNNNAPEAKRQKKESDSVVMKTNYEPRVVVETKSAVDIVNDGYRWRKYGQKMVKGNPNPRSYYRCSNAGCPVKKHVERATRDEKIVITTYEGRHDHDMPSGIRTVTQNIKGNNATSSSSSDDDDDDMSTQPKTNETKTTSGMEMVVCVVR